MTTGKRAFILIFDGFADWEPAYALAGLRRWGKLPVTTVGYDAEPVTSMGGLRVTPDSTLAEVRPEDVRILILPGGDAWEGEYPAAALEPLLRELEIRQVPIAAICAATRAVARAGLLEGRRHTSNDKDYLNRLAPGYGDGADYVQELAVRDRGVITASGLGPLEFAREIFEELGAFSPEDLALWYGLYKHGQMPAP